MRTVIAGLIAAGLAAAPSLAQPAPKLELWRLDCGKGLIKDFNAFFSDTSEYPSGPRQITSSCYLVRHLDHYLLWDTGFAATVKGKPDDWGPLVATLDKTIAEQLAVLGVKPAQITMVGISHRHGDHTGQAREFPGAKLIVGKADFESTAGANDPFAAWRGAGAKTQLMNGGDIDIFGDGSVVALNLPGHTPNHMGLLVKLASGNVLLTGDLYHATEARRLRGVPPFNTSRAETLASIDRFERLAKSHKAKVIIQHEPADIAKLPAFPASAK